MKFVLLVAVPAALIRAMGPVVAPVGTVAMISVAEFTVKLSAQTPLKVTPVTQVRACHLKFVPVIVTVVPAGPLVGLKELMVGGATPVNYDSPYNRQPRVSASSAILLMIFVAAALIMVAIVVQKRPRSPSDACFIASSCAS